MNPTSSHFTIISDKSLITPDDLLALYINLDWVTPRDGALERVATVLERTDGVVGAFTDDGRLIGFIKILSDGSMYTTVAEIIVHPEWQRRGVGRSMIERVRDDWGHTPIFIETFTYNREFFEKCGYTTRENMVVCSKWFVRTGNQESG